MFRSRGWKITEKCGDADLIQFTGGIDVNPNLYGQQPIPGASWDFKRDFEESMIFHQYSSERSVAGSIPMAGICRGGQFLNVMNFGEMYQDVDNHGISGTHMVFDAINNREIQCTSTHHQMMIPSFENGSRLVGYVPDSLCTYKTSDLGTVVEDLWPDTEVVYYERTNSLCFQPHPEYVEKEHECQQWYFELLEDLLKLKA